MIMKKNLLFVFCLLVAAVSAQAQLLWKISGNGLKSPSYMIGTHHLAPLGVLDSIAAFPTIKQEVAQVYGEVKMTDMQTMQMQMMKYMMMPQDTTIAMLLDAGQLAVVKDTVSKYAGAAVLPALDRIKPNVLSQQLVMMLLAMRIPGFNPMQQLDSELQKMATQSGKQTGGLETIDFQAQLLFGQPLSKQAADLYELVQDVSMVVKFNQLVYDLYMKQDLQKIYELAYSEEYLGKFGNSTLADYEMILDRRNRNWAQQMPAIMAEAPTLFAVGALHLPGNQGVIELLKQQGYRVEALQ